MTEIKQPITPWHEIFEQQEAEEEIKYRADYETRMIICQLQNKCKKIGGK